jgi:hypothetical protein
VTCYTHRVSKPWWKRCRRCRDRKPLSDFNRNRSQEDGLNYYCRQCTLSWSRTGYVPKRRPFLAGYTVPCAICDKSIYKCASTFAKTKRVSYCSAKCHAVRFDGINALCLKCKRRMPVTDFYIQRNGRPAHRCKACVSIYGANRTATRSDYSERYLWLKKQRDLAVTGVRECITCRKILSLTLFGKRKNRTPNGSCLDCLSKTKRESGYYQLVAKRESAQLSNGYVRRSIYKTLWGHGVKCRFLDISGPLVNAQRERIRASRLIKQKGQQ